MNKKIIIKQNKLDIVKNGFFQVMDKLLFKFFFF